MAPNCGFQQEYWTSRGAGREWLKSSCYTWLSTCPQLHDTAPLPGPHLCEPTPCTAHRDRVRPSPKRGLMNMAQLRDTQQHGTRLGSTSTAALGEKLFEHGDPYSPHVSRESGKLINRGYKQQDLGNYVPTGIYYLETMSGIKLPGKFRLQSK